MHSLHEAVVHPRLQRQMGCVLLEYAKTQVPLPAVHGGEQSGLLQRGPVNPCLQMHESGICLDGLLGSTQLPPMGLQSLDATHAEQVGPCQPWLQRQTPGATHLPLTQLLHTGMLQSPPDHLVGSVHSHTNAV